MWKEMSLMIKLAKKYGKRLIEMEAGDGGVLVIYLDKNGNEIRELCEISKETHS